MRPSAKSADSRGRRSRSRKSPMSFKALFESTQANLREGRASNPIHVKVRSENQGGFRSTVKMRDFTLTIDQPKGFAGTNAGPKPSEVLLAALAACQETTWRLYADALGIPLGCIRVELDGVQDLRGFLAVTRKPVRAFSALPEQSSWTVRPRMRRSIG